MWNRWRLRTRSPWSARVILRSLVRAAGASACSRRYRAQRSAIVAAVAVQVAVEDLLEDLPPDARGLFDVVAVGGESARIAAVENVARRRRRFRCDARRADGVGPRRGARADGFVSSSPIVATVTASHLGAARAAGLHGAFAEVLAAIPGVDPREMAAHVRFAADLLPRDFSIAVLRASAARRMEESDPDPDGAVADLEVAAALAESAAEGGTRDDRMRAFETLRSFAVAQYFAGPARTGRSRPSSRRTLR